jgi:hypothetical protein
MKCWNEMVGDVRIADQQKCWKSIMYNRGVSSVMIHRKT